MRKNKSKSQTFLEYAVLIAIVAGMLVAMRVYMTRAVQEKYRQSADVYGEGEQYAKGITQVTDLDNPGITILEPDPVKPKTCQEAKANVSNLESDIKDLRTQADSMLQSAAETEKSLPMLQAQADALTAQAGQNDAWGREERKTAADLTAQADDKQKQADDKQKQVDDYKKNNPGCFSGGCATSCADGDSCCCLLDTVAQLQSEAADLRSQAADLRSQAAQHTSRAEGYEAKAKELHAQADSLNGSILKLKEQISNLRAQADDFQNKINAKQAQIDKFKSDFPGCF